MSLARPGGGMSGGVLGSMEVLGCGGLGGECSEGRVSSTVPFDSTSFVDSCPSAELLFGVSEGKSTEAGDHGFSGEGGSRAGPPFTGVLQSRIRDSEGFGCLEANNRSFWPQHLCGIYEVSDGNTAFGTSVGQEGRLDDLDRSQRCIFSDTYSSKLQEVPEVCGSRANLSISGTLFRPLDFSTSLYQGHGPYFSNYASSGFPNSAISRRLVGTRGDIRRSDSGKGFSSSALQGTGYPFEFREEQVNSCSGGSVLRNEDCVSDCQGFSDTREVGQTEESVGRVRFFKGTSGDSVEESPGSDVLSIPPGARVKTQDENASVSVEESMGFRGGSQDCDLGRFLPRGSSVVVRRCKSDPRSTTGVPSAGSVSIFRRVGSRLGCGFGQGHRFRPVVTTSKRFFYKQKRTFGHWVGSRGLCSPGGGTFGGRVLGQRHGDILLEEARGNQISGFERSGTVDLEVVRDAQGFTGSAICGRSSECGGRFLESGQSDTRSGMDTDGGGVQGDPEEVASEHRSICHELQLSAPLLFFTNIRSDGVGDGCDVATMGPPVSVRFSPIRDGATGPQQVKKKQGHSDDFDSSILATETLVCGSVGSVNRCTCHASSKERPAEATTFPPVSSKSTSSSANCVENIRRSARAAGLSSAVAEQLAYCRRKSTRGIYQARWSTYRAWCRVKGHSVSRPSVSKVADFLLYLRRKKGLSYSAIAGYRSTLSAAFRYVLPELSDSSILRDLLKSFKIEKPVKPSRAPPWNLEAVLLFLRSSSFEPLSQASLRDLTMKTLFLVSLATARRVGELHAVSKEVSFCGQDVHLSYLPEFVAKTESEVNPLARSFKVKALSDFVGEFEQERLLCPVRALKYYLDRTKSLRLGCRSLFVSPKCPTRTLSKNALSFFLREVIGQAPGAVTGVGSLPRPRAHGVRSMATSASFLKNWSVAKVIEAATWKSVSVFTSFYLKDVQFSYPDGYGLGPFVAAGQVV